jgi:hypothetical protein
MHLFLSYGKGLLAVLSFLLAQHAVADLGLLVWVLALLLLLGAGYAFWLRNVVAGVGLIVVAFLIVLLL